MKHQKQNSKKLMKTDSKDISRKGPDNRADGWILDEKNKIAVLVEVKIGDMRVDVNQLKRHIKNHKDLTLVSLGLRISMTVNLILIML
jgi:hypothetical protein